jgi:hypothetical protein
MVTSRKPSGPNTRLLIEENRKAARIALRGLRQQAGICVRDRYDPGALI